MYDYTIVGIQEGIEGKSKTTGKEYHGLRIHYTYEDKKVDGVACGNLFVNPDYVSMDFVPKIGDRIQPLYNRYGSVESIAVLGG